MFARVLGTQHGVDSQYFFILLNYGLILLVMYLRYFMKALRFMINKIRSDHRLSAALVVGSLLAWLIVGFGQQLGAAKAMALGVQLAAIVELLRARRYKSQPLGS
jgi:hypothetical protein